MQSKAVPLTRDVFPQGKEESIGAYGVKGSYYANLPHSQTYLSYDIPRAENWLGPSGR